jgi:hypothetical protein
MNEGKWDKDEVFSFINDTFLSIILFIMCDCSFEDVICQCTY